MTIEQKIPKRKVYGIHYLRVPEHSTSKWLLDEVWIASTRREAQEQVTAINKRPGYSAELVICVLSYSSWYSEAEYYRKKGKRTPLNTHRTVSTPDPRIITDIEHRMYPTILDYACANCTSYSHLTSNCPYQSKESYNE